MNRFEQIEAESEIQMGRERYWKFFHEIHSTSLARPIHKNWSLVLISPHRGMVSSRRRKCSSQNRMPGDKWFHNSRFTSPLNRHFLQRRAGWNRLVRATIDVYREIFPTRGKLGKRAFQIETDGKFNALVTRRGDFHWLICSIFRYI